MSELDRVKNIAKEVLIISASVNTIDYFFWDRGQRLVHNTELICNLPELADYGFQIDYFCLYSAAYFCYAGLARQFGAEKTGAKPAFPATNGNGNNMLDSSTEIVEQTLGAYIDGDRISKINLIITESGSHSTTMPEAMILSDSRNLDDMGIIGIVDEFRRSVSNSKSIFNALQTWQRKIDYRYWEARLEDGFRFKSVRKIAEQRLKNAEHFMNQLKTETQAQDLEELLANPSMA